jgi:hypothetical protein
MREGCLARPRKSRFSADGGFLCDGCFFGDTGLFVAAGGRTGAGFFAFATARAVAGFFAVAGVLAVARAFPAAVRLVFVSLRFVTGMRDSPSLHSIFVVVSNRRRPRGAPLPPALAAAGGR